MLGMEEFVGEGVLFLLVHCSMGLAKKCCEGVVKALLFQANFLIVGIPVSYMIKVNCQQIENHRHFQGLLVNQMHYYP